MFDKTRFIEFLNFVNSPHPFIYDYIDELFTQIYTH